MGKHRWLVIPAVLMIFFGSVVSAQAERTLPAEIEKAIAGTNIIHTAYWDGPGSTWFVLARAHNETNILFCFTLDNDVWVQSFYTISAVPQGKDDIQMIHVTDKFQDFTENRTWPGPLLIILFSNGSYTSYQRSDSGQWNLFRVFSQDEQVFMDYNDDSIIFRTPIDQDHSRYETVFGKFERDLRKINLNCIPETPAQAQKMLEETQSETETQTQP